MLQQSTHCAMQSKAVQARAVMLGCAAAAAGAAAVGAAAPGAAAAGAVTPAGLVQACMLGGECRAFYTSTAMACHRYGCFYWVLKSTSESTSMHALIQFDCCCTLAVNTDQFRFLAA